MGVASWVPTCSGVVLFAPVAVKRENTAFELVLQSVVGLLSFGKQVDVALHVRKEKVISGQNICSRDASVGNGKNVEKHAQSCKG